MSAIPSTNNLWHATSFGRSLKVESRSALLAKPATRMVWSIALGRLLPCLKTLKSQI